MSRHKKPRARTTLLPSNGNLHARHIKDCSVGPKTSAMCKEHASADLSTKLVLSPYKGPGLQEIRGLYSKPSMTNQQRPRAFVKIAAL
jgi:hypothetical protein